MATSNRRVAAYLPNEIDSCLQTYKTEHSLTGDSQAIILILSQFFGVNQAVAHEVSYRFASLEQLQKLETKVEELEKLLTHPQVDSPPSESSSPIQGELPVDPSSNGSFLACPKCKSENLGKNGHDDRGRQKYKCKDCGRYFKQ